jgi:hypothetical protein
MRRIKFEYVKYLYLQQQYRKKVKRKQPPGYSPETKFLQLLTQKNTSGKKVIKLFQAKLNLRRVRF